MKGNYGVGFVWSYLMDLKWFFGGSGINLFLVLWLGFSRLFGLFIWVDVCFLFGCECCCVSERERERE